MNEYVLMTWLVFAVSCLLVLAGAVSLISGAPIIQLERGWAEVIAGAVALSSGGIVFALAAILVRLEALREAIAIGAASNAQPVLISAEEPPAASTDSPLPLVEEFPVSAPAETVADLVSSESNGADADDATNERHGLWKRVRRSEGPAVLASIAEPIPDPLSSDLEAPKSAVDLDRVERQEAPVAAVDLLSSHTPAAVPIEVDSPAVVPEDRYEEQSLSWLDRSLFRSRPKTPLPRDPDPVPADRLADPHPERSFAALPGRVEPSLDASPPVAAHLHPEAHDGPAASDMRDHTKTTTIEESETATSADEVTVIGRYQAGVASYIMYSDGTIEVETEGGELHRFASMEELKAYIAAQDSPVA